MPVLRRKKETTKLDSNFTLFSPLLILFLRLRASILSQSSLRTLQRTINYKYTTELMVLLIRLLTRICFANVGWKMFSSKIFATIQMNKKSKNEIKRGNLIINTSSVESTSQHRSTL